MSGYTKTFQLKDIPQQESNFRIHRFSKGHQTSEGKGHMYGGKAERTCVFLTTAVLSCHESVETEGHMYMKKSKGHASL